jgi:catalase
MGVRRDGRSLAARNPCSMTDTQPNPVQTTDAGIPVESDEYSLTVGAGGPILLQDSYLIEQMARHDGTF